MKYYVTSDLHGFYTPLIKALTNAGYFEDSEPHKLIILGDLFDRGKEPKELQNFILDLMSRDEVILIKGNHEDLFVEFATTDMGIAYQHHVSNGTYDTALWLTDYFRKMARVQPLEFIEAIKETPLYSKIIPSMVDYYETEKYIFVHGWIPCIRERDGSFSYITQWRESSPEEWARARWCNGMDASAQGVTEENKTILCGHWNTSYGHSKFEGHGSEFGLDADFSPYYGAGIIALDACTVRSGKVNCIVIED